jgi:hypothetical protein
MTPDTDDRERTLLELTRALPREVVPPARVWTAIQAEATPAARAAPAPARAPLRFWQRPALLAAAALLLVAGSSAATASFVLLANRGAGASIPGRAGTGATSSPSLFAEFAARENDYLHQVNTLVAVVEDEANGLSPETIATIRANLLVIDAAILEVRRALADDPANRRLVEILASTYEKKVDLLRRTGAMARS